MSAFKTILQGSVRSQNEPAPRRARNPERLDAFTLTGREGRGTQAVSQVRLRHLGNGDNRRPGDQQSPRYRCSEQVARSVGINTDLKPKMGSGRKAQILARGVAETRRETCPCREPAEGSRGRVSASECQQ